MLSNFKLIVITPEKSIDGEAQIINKLFESGLQALHIRKHDHTRQDVINLLSGIDSNFHKGIVIHQHYELLNEYDLKGAHLPENRRLEGGLKGIRTIISTSFHNLVDITRERASYEYAFYSPVFRSISKKGHGSSVDPAALKIYFQSDPPFPIVALGGIDENKIILAKQIGFNGAACIGYIWGNPDPVGQFKKLTAIMAD